MPKRNRSTTPGLLISRYTSASGYSARRQMAIPSSQVTPMCTCPGLRPRAVSRILAHCASRTAAFHRLQGVGFHPAAAGLSQCPRLYIFRGSITRPAHLLRLASDSRYRAYPQTSLLTCSLGSSQVGLPINRSVGADSTVSGAFAMPVSQPHHSATTGSPTG